MTFIRVALTALIILQLHGCATPAILAGATAGGAMMAHDRRTAGSQIDDQSIEFKALGRMAEDAELGKAENAHINVTSFNGVVLLTGETVTPELRQRAEALVEALPRVRKVYNEIKVDKPAPLSSRTGDTWITTKVKAKLLANESVDGTRIKVVTDRGVVYLMGLVTRGESNLATSIASDTGGVTRIVRVFEYLD